MAILNTTLRLVGRPDELRAQLFTRSLEVRRVPRSPTPAAVFAGLPGVEGWEASAPGSYLLTVPDPDAAAPGWPEPWCTPAPTSCRSPSPATPSRTSTCELVDEDVEAKRR